MALTSCKGRESRAGTEAGHVGNLADAIKRYRKSIHLTSLSLEESVHSCPFSQVASFVAKELRQKEKSVLEEGWRTFAEGALKH